MRRTSADGAGPVRLHGGRRACRSERLRPRRPVAPGPRDSGPLRLPRRAARCAGDQRQDVEVRTPSSLAPNCCPGALGRLATGAKAPSTHRRRGEFEVGEAPTSSDSAEIAVEMTQENGRRSARRRTPTGAWPEDAVAPAKRQRKEKEDQDYLVSVVLRYKVPRPHRTQIPDTIRLHRCPQAAGRRRRPPRPPLRRTRCLIP